MKQLTKKLITSIALPAALLLSAQQASATVILTFDQSNPTSDGIMNGEYGTLSYSGNGDSLNGTGITFDTVTVSGAGLAETTYTIDMLLNFSTGSNISEGNSSGGTWLFNPGVNNSFNLTDTNGNILINGEFSKESSITGNGNPPIFNFSGEGNNEVDSSFLSRLNVSGNYTGFSFVNTEVALASAVIGTNGSFEANVSESDITSFSMTLGASPTPSSGATFSMLGIGLCFLELARRRISFAKSTLN